MKQFRTVRCDMWDGDDWFAELEPDAKLVWIYTFTCGKSSPAGIYRIALRTIANETGISIERVRKIITAFQESGKLEYENGVIWPKTMRKHQIGDLNPKDNLVKKIANDLADLPQSGIVARYMEYYRESEPPSDPLPTPSEVPPVNRRQETGDKRQETGTTVDAPAPAAEFAAQFSAFANRIHLVASAYQVQEMADRLTTLRERNALDWWDMALKVAEDNNARKWAYVRATLDNCIAAGTPPGAPKPGGKSNGKSATSSAFSAYPRTEADDSYEANNTPERLAAAQIEWDRGQAELATRRSAALSNVQGQGMAGL